jgi:NhaA family Na+:H+ antiporter
MAFFFLVVGLEIKREIVKGELRNRKTAILPIGAAVGGMVAPALIYLVFNSGTPAAVGWGIPMATDIAFAVAVLSLLGNCVPAGLKIFLLTLAIVDDMGAISVIALFYTESLQVGYLLAAAGIITAVALGQRYLSKHLALVILAGALLWLAFHFAGVHASIAGAIIGLMTPIGLHGGRKTVAEDIEELFLPFTTFIILPLFALANAGFVINGDIFSGSVTVALGITLGLLIGKFVGITAVSWILVKLRIATLPNGVNWRQIAGVSLIAGIGFTVSIFITELAFDHTPAEATIAKIGIFIASLVGAMLGIVMLRSPKIANS